MKVFYVHNTPLAGLAALGRTTRSRGGLQNLRIDEKPFLCKREHFMRAGRDAGGREIYAVWMKSDGVILTRLIESFCEIYHIPKESYVVHQIPSALGLQLRLVNLTYQLGLFSLARILLRRLGGVGKSLAALAVVD